MSFRISLSRTVIDKLDSMDRGMERRIMGVLYQLAAAPTSDDLSVAVEVLGVRAARCDDTRIFYTVSEATEDEPGGNVIHVLALRPVGRDKRDAFRRLVS